MSQYFEMVDSPTHVKKLTLEQLQRLAEEDPTFRITSNQETGQTIISGMGELHLDIIKDRMFREFNVGAVAGRPQVAYRETITKAAEAEGKFIRQSGGRGQYGEVYLVHRIDLPTSGLLVFARTREANKRIAELASRFGFELDPEAKVGTLSVGQHF